MAYIIKNDNTTATTSAELGATYWTILHGYKEGTPEQEEYCSKIKKIYLNWRKAPDEWIKDNFDKLKEKAKNEWYVDNQGIPTRPQYKKDWDLKNKWGL
jgi:hypothetical protein